jgi:hypothetical protein
MTVERFTPTQVSHLERGTVYRVTGDGEGVEMLPVQVFRFERIDGAFNSGAEQLVGTLWWKVWVHGRWFSGTQKNHVFAAHHLNIGIGSRLSSKHNFHLEKMNSAGVRRTLGDGLAYADYMRDILKEEMEANKARLNGKSLVTL